MLNGSRLVPSEFRFRKTRVYKMVIEDLPEDNDLAYNADLLNESED